MADNTFLFTVITPDGEFYNEPVDQILISTSEGEMGILFNHIPTTVALSTGPCIIKKDGKEIKGLVHGGFAEIGEDQVILLPDAAEWPDSIDFNRARKAKEKAEKMIEIGHEDVHTLSEAKQALARAVTRLDVEQWVDKN